MLPCWSQTPLTCLNVLLFCSDCRLGRVHQKRTFENNRSRFSRGWDDLHVVQPTVSRQWSELAALTPITTGLVPSRSTNSSSKITLYPTNQHNETTACDTARQQSMSTKHDTEVNWIWTHLFITYHHGCMVANSQRNQMAKFHPSVDPKPTNGLQQYMEYITMSPVWPYTEIHLALWVL